MKTFTKGDDDHRHWFDKLTFIMDQNIRGVQYGVYSVALIGLAVAIRSVRPMKKFRVPSEIPQSFFHRHLRLCGRVIRIEAPTDSKSAYLMVNHFPILSLRLSNVEQTGLPVHISSVDLSANGISWLQHVVVGSDINFTLLKSKPEYVSCVVSKKNVDIGHELVNLGFATVSTLDFDLEKDPLYMKYYKSLMSAENRAEKHGFGMWLGEGRWWYRCMDWLKYKIPHPLSIVQRILKKKKKQEKVGS